MSGTAKRNIFVCYLSDAILGTYFQLPIWIVYQSKFLSFEQIAFYSGLALLTEVIMQMPTGAFADMYGRKLSLALGNLFMALPMFLIALYPNTSIMLLYSFMWGLGNAFCMGTNKPIVYETLQKEGRTDLFAKILGKSVVTFQISAAISILIGGYLYQVSPQLPYYVSGIGSLIGVFTAFLFIEPKIQKTKFNIKKFMEKNKEGFLEIFKTSYLTKLTILFVLMGGIASVNQKFFVQPYMVELGMGDIERSWVSMLIKIFIAVLGAKIISYKRISNKKAFILTLPILMVLTLLPASIVTLPLAYITFTGIAFTSGNSGLFISPEIQDHLNSSVRSTALSAQKMLLSFVGVLIQWISAPIIAGSSVGNFYVYLGIFTLVCILPLAWNIMLSKKKMESLVLDIGTTESSKL